MLQGYQGRVWLRVLVPGEIGIEDHGVSTGHV